ncbi:hypothetical protein CVT26_001692 [Gymnopilus dilepis]|uniref:Uncharacterized protein n=1 Tax=Gymnopilus dilepis TaxID=231916 RepID=A0A409VRI1_9AGAR|nr:hypothetical protein CVT26_001692 [Gymnopilus dilepis]
MPATLGIRGPDLNGADPTGPVNPNDDLVHYFHVAALVTIFYDHCDIGLKFVGTGSMVIIIITQLIMQLRIKALYGKIISTLITVFWVMEVIAVLGLGIASLAAIDVHPVFVEAARMCNPTYLPRFAFLFWVPVIVFETFLFILALGIARRNYKEIGNWRGASLLYIVLRDNFFFFICAFAIYVLTATTWLTANPRYFTVPGAFSGSLTSIMGCRLIINLCEAYHHPRDSQETGSPPRSIWAATTKNIQFLKPPSKSAASGLPRWSNWGRSHRTADLVPIDNPSPRLASMPNVKYGNGSGSTGEDSDIYEMRVVASMPEKAKRLGGDDDESKQGCGT